MAIESKNNQSKMKKSMRNFVVQENDFFIWFIIR